MRGASPVLDSPLNLASAPEKQSVEKLRAMSGGQRLKLVANFARQLHVLVGTGIPLSQALSAVERQAQVPAWKAVATKLHAAVDEGTPLSVAMKDCGAFDAVSISLILAGETSGNMPMMLQRLAELKRRQLKMRTAIVGSLAYPTMLICMGGGVLVTMLLFVIPRFEILFKSLDSPLPPTTKLLLLLSRLLQEYWWAVILGAVALVAGIYQLLKSEAGKIAFDRYYLRLPLIGALGRNLLSARAARMLGTLIESKVPLIESLQLTNQSAANVQYSELFVKAENAVARGQPLSDVFDATDLVVPGVQEAIRIGEQSGRMGEPLIQMAEFLDEENDVAMRSLTSLIEPVILIGLGLVVGVVALSIFLPMFDMITAAQGGG